MNIVCVKCGTGVAYGLASLTDQTVVVCPGCGAGLRVALQAFDVPAARSQPHGASSPAQGRVLVAVDGEATREMIRELLCGAGFEVLDAASGREAVARVAQEQPSLVLVDVGLTDLRGHQVCEAIRGLPTGSFIKIILVAAIHNKARYRRDPDNLFGADDFIERHQIERDLLGKVTTWCHGGPHEPGLSAPVPGASGDSNVAQLHRGERVSAVAPGSEHPVVSRTAPQPAAATGVRAPAAARPVAPVQASSLSPPASAGLAAMAAPPAVPDRSEPAIAPVPPPAVKPAPTNTVPSGTVSKPRDPGQEAALRLARIIISDIALYNTKKVDESILQGTFFDALRHEIGEGRRLYEERRSPDLPRTIDLFQQTLDQFVATRKQLLQRNHQAAA